jgi:hypothetical protein
MLDMNWVREQMNNASSQRSTRLAEKTANTSGRDRRRRPAWILTSVAVGVLLAAGIVRSINS